MTKTIQHDACTTDGMPHRYKFHRRYSQMYSLHTVFVSKCQVCGHEKHRPSTSKREQDMTERGVAA